MSGNKKQKIIDDLNGQNYNSIAEGKADLIRNGHWNKGTQVALNAIFNREIKTFKSSGNRITYNRDTNHYWVQDSSGKFRSSRGFEKYIKELKLK